MNALVLSGGANKGCFEAGAIEVILKSGFIPDGIYGVSVGSLNALFLADRAGRAIGAKQQPDWPQVGSDLVAFWQQKITGPSSFIQKRWWLAIAWGVLTSKFNGLFDTAPLRRLIDDSFRKENITAWRANGKFSMGVVNLWSSLYSDVEEDGANLFDYAMASSAIPVYMPGIEIKKVPHFDGGLRNIAPFKRAMNDGATTLYAVVCQPETIPATQTAAGNPIALLERVIDILTSQIINNDVKMATDINDLLSRLPVEFSKEAIPFLAKKHPVDLQVIRPDTELPIQLADFGPRDVQTLIDLGRAKAKQVLGIRE